MFDERELWKDMVHDSFCYAVLLVAKRGLRKTQEQKE